MRFLGAGREELLAILAAVYTIKLVPFGRLAGMSREVYLDTADILMSRPTADGHIKRG